MGSYWDDCEKRSEPVSSFEWGADTINSVRFNQAEVSVLASCGTDRTVILYDVRYNSPLAKLVLRMKSNAICWNPMEPFNFTVANEDHNLYTFDMRKMKSALNVYKDHVSAVYVLSSGGSDVCISNGFPFFSSLRLDRLDVDYSPTGQELVSGSYDQTVRIFPVDQGRSRDVYHTKRMQHVFCVRYSMDSKYILSGSDDGNLRLWKTHASEKVEETSHREKAAHEYREALKQRYAHMPELRRISKSRHVPAAIKNAKKKESIMIQAETRKKENRKKHSKPTADGKGEFKAERQRSVVTVVQ